MEDYLSQQNGGGTKTYYFAGGCFWGTEKKFSELKGVFETKVGYMGGSLKNPTYEQVSKGNTGHVETVLVKSNLSLKKLLQSFFSFHDYTSLDHQGPDIGPQYRAVFFYQGKNQLKIFQNFVKKYKNVKTKAYPVKEFYVAEDYHQMYSFQKPCKSLKTEDKQVFQKICKNNTKKAELKNYGKYLHNKDKGIYYCSCCGNELYHSKNQYDSGSGWPAFSKSFDESHLLYNPNNDELRCSSCGLHLGHRTFDGPTSTKIHDCINSVCLYFKKKKQKGGGSTKKLPHRKNIRNEKLEVCSKKPMTGYYRDGYCMTGPDDLGTHTVCAKMDKKFLQYTKKKGNDLSSVVKPGQKWCLCENRWNQAFLDGKSPKVVRGATNMRTKKSIQKNMRKSRVNVVTRKKKKGGGKTKKQFLYNPDDPKKSFDVYIDKNPKDTIPRFYEN
jgi:peptide methionine sulfoxide reductase msrA/msrB